MQTCVKSIVALLIVALTLIPGAYADSLGGGASVSSSGGSAQGVLVSGSSGTASQATFTNSNVDYNNWLDDVTGKHVEETLKVVQGSGTYKCEFKKGSTVVNPDSVNHLVPSSTSLSATQQLTVSYADEIHAGAKASNSEGDQASVDVNVLIGSITGYKNTATATQSQATATQSATSVSGSYIEFLSRSNNNELDNACASLKVQGGSVKGYASTATTIKSQAAASQSASSATGSYIEFLSKSRNKELDNACSSLETYGGYGYAGTVANYVSSASATLSQAITSQSVASVSGNPIIFESYANNREKDNVSPSLEIYQGSVTSYQDSATATSTKATVSVLSAKISGAAIYASSGACNSEGDKSIVGMTTGPLTTITGFTESATATSTKATSTLSMKSGSGTSIVLQGQALNRLKSTNFQYPSQKFGSTSLTTEATASKVVITPKIT